MPSKNSVKQFVADSYYHLYNRGVEKRIIFLDKQDYAVFLSYLKTYLLPKDIVAMRAVLSNTQASLTQKNEAIKLLRMNNFSDQAELIAYCLMPNHFHLLVKQKDPTVIDQFMNSLCTRYSVYFNRRHKRVGGLFQDVYKAVRVVSDEQLIHLSRYIHRNPDTKGDAFKTYEYSSYLRYLGLRRHAWVQPQFILNYFAKKGPNSYESFVEDKADIEIISRVALDFEAD